MEEFAIKPLTLDTWNAFAALVDRHEGIFGGCWCIWFHPDCEEHGRGLEADRARKREQVERGEEHAALVLAGGRAVAWCEFSTPGKLRDIRPHPGHRSAGLDLPDYRLTCLFVDKEYRGRGLSELALRGALDLIAREGGGVVEGDPQDLSDGRRVGDSFRYKGTRALYERAGFTYDRPKGTHHTVMRLTVAAA